MSSGGTPLFELREVSFRYEEIVAIDACSLSIERGTRVALLGANGSGKSTLLLLLDALQPPSSGLILFDGEELTPAALADERANHDFRRRVGFVFQNPEVQLFNPTVRDEIAFGPLQLGSGLNITVMSAIDRLCVGVLACKRRMPDVALVTQAFVAEIALLKRLARRTRRRGC